MTRGNGKSTLSLKKMMDFLLNSGAFDAYFKEKEYNMRNVFSKQRRKEIENDSRC